MKSCFWKHDWGKWKEIEKTFKLVHKVSGKEYITKERWQRRRCKRCGKIQEEII